MVEQLWPLGSRSVQQLVIYEQDTHEKTLRKAGIGDSYKGSLFRRGKEPSACSVTWASVEQVFCSSLKQETTLSKRLVMSTAVSQEARVTCVMLLLIGFDSKEPISSHEATILYIG